MHSGCHRRRAIGSLEVVRNCVPNFHNGRPFAGIFGTYSYLDLIGRA